jgi:hypothetical protein
MRKPFDSRSVALAIGAGLTLAAQSCKNSGAPAGSTESTSAAVAASGSAKGDKACCKGLNDCKGKGGCAVPGKHECAGKNDCKGQGGCNMHCPK